MSGISAVVIAKNAENLIADCLESISFCDEIILVDAGSKDRTVEIAERVGAEVFEYESVDFSELRNFGLQKAKGEWVLYVDTDERATSELARNIKYQISLLRQGFGGQANLKCSIVAYKIKRKNFYLGNHEWPYVEKIERLFKKSHLKGWKGKLHESPIIDGKVGELEGYLLHYTHRDLTLMLEKTIEWSKIEAELRLKAGHPKMAWWRFPRVMIFVFFESYIRQGGWKLGVVGLIESLYQSFSIFITYARLWEMQHEKERI
ncbi:MAG: glycosyltransferase family 2 protein [Candidatus Levybacteria bacterium]|nr:glycosyltransferase family 2 protein [Candidatus Levybacteria bacterium]